MPDDSSSMRIVFRARGSSTSITNSRTCNRTDSRSDNAIRYLETRDVSHRIVHRHPDRTSNYPHAIGRGISDVEERQQQRCNEMDARNHERIYASSTRTNHYSYTCLPSVRLFRQFRMVCEAFLNRSKKALPIGAVTSAFLLTAFDHAKAETLLERGDITKHGIFNKENFANNSWEETKEFFALWGEIGSHIKTFFQWCNNLPENIPQYTVDILAKIFELLTSTVLYTPLFIFNNSHIQDATIVFSGISVLIVTILAMVEGGKKMLKKRNTDWKKILKRYSLSLLGVGFAPFVFEQVFNLINIITKLIVKVGSIEIGGFQLFQKMEGKVIVPGLGIAPVGLLDTVLLLAFDIVAFALLIPIVLQTARRWWDLLCLSALTPLSLTAWIFDDYHHYFHKWWSNLKQLAQSQLVYAIYICLMGVFMYGTANMVSGGGLIFKLLVICGGLWRMANPPSFVTSRIDNGKDIEETGLDMKKTYKNIRDTVTLKNIRTLKFLKDKEEGQKKEVASLRKKHGRRYVGDLLK